MTIPEIAPVLDPWQVWEARAAGAGGKVIAFVMANIHAGEVEGKEACLMLAREIGLNPNDYEQVTVVK